MNPYAKALFDLARESAELQRAALAGADAVELAALRHNHAQHITAADELRTEGRAPSPRLAELANPHG